MKLNLNSAILAAALMLPTMGAFAADEKEQPRPAQESRGTATTGKEATKPAETAPTPTPVDTKEGGKAQPRTEAKDSKEQPRPAQESRSGTTTGKEATKPVDSDKAK